MPAQSTATANVDPTDDLVAQFRRFHQRISSLERASTSGTVTGPPSSAPLSYAYNQSTAATIWTITHNLNFYPNVTVIDSGNSVVEGQIDYLTINTVRLTFSAAFSGIAYLS